jgi:putative acetyltransferase
MDKQTNLISIRPEHDSDIPAIRAVNVEAFGRPDEANLVDALRVKNVIILSLVATLDRHVVAHVIFTPITIEDPNSGSMTNGIGLGPVAVLPSYQNKGIGSHLIQEGLTQCRHLGHEICIVLGHPEYYPRFGFSPSEQFGITSSLEVPAEAFMVAELIPGALHGIRGIARYHSEFDSV